ncbi:2-methylcitrate dehydratase PrpD [Neorhizobium huautlense]|uniref:2-methylcitrate dehydratase PrpD n=1 Tax=Neorhizobium huautlense TaxID=67774 RepID=A0ABT9PLW6_9HYPH|nr:MmgE/PrpD family protein [Neorhizobium huautlense]MDP9835454.1 2-methylcitrate dehydratase PrpD [Neorhizobium huautlense]
MTMVTPAIPRASVVSGGIIPASVLLAEPRPQWLIDWARFATDLAFDELSPDLIAQAKLVMLDCIGAIACGMREPEMLALAARLSRRGGGEIAAIGAGIGLCYDDAAFLNGTAGTVLELDEGNQFARGHPGMHVLPAALSMATAGGKSGWELLQAFILGYEVAARTGAACRLRPTVHPHGTWGTIGAAFATALLDGADEAELIETINVSATLSVGASLRAMLEGATVRNSFCGFSNRNGMAAWDLVASGFTGEINSVGTVYGGILAEGFRPDVMTEQLGTRFEIQRNYFKRHAACRYTHATLDVVCSLMAQHGRIAPEAISAIEVVSYASAAQLDITEPANMLAAKFSLPFAIATTIVNGEASVPAFRQAAVENETVRALAAKISVAEKPEYTALLPDKRPAHVTIRLADGQTLTAETMTNRGDAVDPYSPQEVRDKYFELVEPVWGRSHAARILDAIETIDTAENLSGLNALLAQPAIKEA